MQRCEDLYELAKGGERKWLDEEGNERVSFKPDIKAALECIKTSAMLLGYIGPVRPEPALTPDAIASLKANAVRMLKADPAARRLWEETGDE